MSFDTRILEAVNGSTREKPKDLASILAYVDFRERLLLTHQEMAGGLCRLVEQGLIAEVADHRFHEVAPTGTPGAFSGLTPEKYQQACEAYQERFRAIQRKPSKK